MSKRQKQEKAQGGPGKWPANADSRVVFWTQNQERMGKLEEIRILLAGIKIYCLCLVLAGLATLVALALLIIFGR